MQHNTESYEYDDQPEQGSGGGFIARLKDWFNRDDDELEEEEAAAVESNATYAVPPPSRAAGGSYAPLRRGSSTLRLESSRPIRVVVRRMVQSFEDVRNAVDGLREGAQQIVNLEQTPADISERLIDFMNGATYATDGRVEKIGEQVYLFTPHNVIIDVENSSTAQPRTAFFDRD